jgi:hypothetical protein
LLQCIEGYNTGNALSDCKVKSPEEFINILHETKLNTLSINSVLFKNEYILMYKLEELGKFYKKMESVYGIIEQELKNERMEVQLKALIENLKSKYKIEIDLTGIDN